MLNKLTPDCWVLFRSTEGQEHYRLLCGWDGNYKDENGKIVNEEWKVSGGIQSAEETGKVYIFHTVANTTYECDKSAFGVKDSIYHVWRKLVEDHDSTMVRPTQEKYIDINWKL